MCFRNESKLLEKGRLEARKRVMSSALSPSSGVVSTWVRVPAATSGNGLIRVSKNFFLFSVSSDVSLPASAAPGLASPAAFDASASSSSSDEDEDDESEDDDSSLDVPARRLALVGFFFAVVSFFDFFSFSPDADAAERNAIPKYQESVKI